MLSSFCNHNIIEVPFSLFALIIGTGPTERIKMRVLLLGVAVFSAAGLYVFGISLPL